MTLSTGKDRFDGRRSEGDMEYCDATGLFVPVDGTAVTGDVPTKQADGTVMWETPSGSGGTSAGSILAYAFSNATSGPTADSAVDVLVPSLTTSFSLASTTVVSIRFSVRASKNTGYIVLSIYDSGVKLLPTAGGGAAPPPNAWYMPGQVNGGERQNQQGAFEAVISLASGAHQIDIYHAASGNLNAVSWYERCVIVTQMA